MTPAVLDITILTILILSTLIACWRGFVREMFTIIGLGLAAFGAVKGGHLLIPVFNDWFNVTSDGGESAAEAVSKGANADAATHAAIQAAHSKAELFLGVISPALAAKICAYGCSFLAVFLIMTLVSFFVTRSIEEMGLGLIDKLVGAAFGFARGCLLIFLPYVICFMMAGNNTDKFPVWAKNSASVPVLEEVYAYADRKFHLGDKIKSRGDALVLKFGGDPEKASPPEIDPDLKDEISKEEKDRKPPK